MKARIGIFGYGNLGRGVESAIRQNDDMELVAVFTRRNPKDVSISTSTAAVCSAQEMENWKDKIDVMILCGGSARIFRSRRQNAQSSSMWWTALIPMPGFQSILPM